MLQIACDGSCLGNPGPGGWAAVILTENGKEQVLSGGEPNTTNNRMELTAAIRAVEAVPEGTAATLYCDSQYVVKGITEWLPAWVRRGWRTAGRQPVKNADLWQRLAAARARRPAVRFQWVRGHSGHAGNERAHDLASEEAVRQGRRTATDGRNTRLFPASG
jgi:ribonuclease HI